MKKRILSFLLVAVMIVSILPMQVFAVTNGDTLQAVDTGWYNSSAESGTVFEIADAADLRGAAKLSQEGVTFAGYTLKLTANIDLNPGWDAEVKIANGKATLPDAPTVEFVGFATFAGTLDGDGHTVSGIYMAQKLLAGSANLGFIEILNGTVKNLVINNSLIYADIADGVNDCKVGGIAARTNSTSALIDTVYADINIWYRGWSWQRVAGIVAKTNVEGTFNNVAFVGTVGAMSPDYAVPHYNNAALPADMTMSQIIGDGNWKANVLTNCALNGEVIIPANVAAGAVDATAPIGKCVGGSVSLTNVAANAELPATVAAMNPAAYTNGLEVFNLWPSATADKNTASYNEGKQAYVKYYTGASESIYKSYLSTLGNNGYEESATYTVGNNKYALYQKAGAYSVFVSYLTEGNKRMRVFVEPFGSEYNTVSEATSASVCEAKIWQLDVDNNGSEQDGGMSYVIRLTDGTFIVIDGGYSTNSEAKNLYQLLNYNNVNGGKPVIRAWFITHLHNDHYGALITFARQFASSVTVEGFYYNFPGSDVTGTENTDILDVDAIRDVEMAMDLFPTAARYRKIHSGMTFGFAGATATVLGTHEDVKQSYYKYSYSLTANDFKDGNDTSAVIKFTVGSQTIMILGDARTGMSKQLEYSYPASVLKSDIVQMAHHGYTGVQDSLYEAIDASVVLWPMDVVGNNNEETLFYYYLNNSGDLDIAANDYIRNNADEIIPAHETVCLTLPYTANSYSGAGNQTVDLTEAYNDKLYRLATEGKGADTSWYSEDKSVYYLYDANDLLGFAQLAAAGNTFAGKTVMLMNNIDLNPGWNADVTIGDKVVFPAAAATAWPNIASFKGTLDGNGYTLSGIYKTMTVSGSTGAYGGLFNTLAGGTVKNLRISNSFVLAANTGAGSGNIHVGGISGDIAAGSNVYNVVMDDSVEVWFKSDSQACVGGGFGYSTGSFTLQGFVFVGTVGNTSSANATNYSCSGTFYIATMLAATGGKTSTMINGTGLAESIYTGKKNNTWGAAIGTWQDGMTAKQLASTRESADWLINTRPTDYGVSHYWSDTLNSIIPKECKDLVEGTYTHVVDDARNFETPEIFYQMTEVANGKYDIRFVSGINNIEDPSRVGFEITIKVGGQSYTIPVEQTLKTTVYTSVLCNGQTVNAENLGNGYDYLYTCSITGVTAADDIIIDVAVVYEVNGELITSAPVSFSFIYGTGNII